MLDYRLIVDEIDFLSAFQTNGEFLITVLDFQHPMLKQRIDSLSTVNSSRKIACGYSLSSDGLLPDGLVCAIKKGDEFWDLILPVRMNELMQQLKLLIKNSIGNLQYIPPLRHLPPRYFDLSGAEMIWQRLFDEPKILEQVNDWLSQKNNYKESTKKRHGYELVVEEFISRRIIKQELPSLVHEQMAKISYAWHVDDLSLNEDMLLIVDKLKDRFFSTEAFEFLCKNEDLHMSLTMHELDQESYSEAYYDETGNDFTDQPEEVQMKYVKRHLNWEAYINADEFEEGDYWAVTLFRRWLFSQPELLDFMECNSDSDEAIRKFLPSSTLEKKTVRREIQLRQIHDNLQVSLQDVGVGISQILPVLLHAYGEKNKFIAIEQPEIHIHPRLQADIADVFIESALGDNQNTFLLETHSEHLILRLLRRIRETTENDFSDWPEELKIACPNGIRPEDVSVLYVEPGEEGAQVTELPITPDGDFSRPWPSGFFTERSKELF